MGNSFISKWWINIDNTFEMYSRYDFFFFFFYRDTNYQKLLSNILILVKSKRMNWMAVYLIENIIIEERLLTQIFKNQSSNLIDGELMNNKLPRCLNYNVD